MLQDLMPTHIEIRTAAPIHLLVKMFAMKTSPDWSKYGAIATYAALVVAIILWFVDHIWPVDPAHPMSLDFLSKSIVISPWLAALALVVAIAATARITYRLAGRQAAPTQRSTIEAASLRVIDLPKSVPSATQSPTASVQVVSPTKTYFSIISPDGLRLTVERYENQDGKGLLATFHNEGLMTIARTNLRILTARSFDSKHNDYRDGVPFAAITIPQMDPIPGSESGKGIWLLRKAPSASDLRIGNDQDRYLKWPTNDTSTIQKWLLHIDYGAQLFAKAPGAAPSPLERTEVYTVVAWNRDTNEFFIEHALASALR